MKRLNTLLLSSWESVPLGTRELTRSLATDSIFSLEGEAIPGSCNYGVGWIGGACFRRRLSTRFCHRSQSTIMLS